MLLKVLSYNLHKGFSLSNSRLELARMREQIRVVGADLVLLQEVQGEHHGHRTRFKDWPTSSQFEFLADEIWPHFAYGKNAVYDEGHHGNAILSKYPISSWQNVDLTNYRLEKRGVIHAKIQIPGYADPVHIFCLHLDLFEASRKTQIQKIAKHIVQETQAGSRIIVGGDFNDWRGSASGVLLEVAELRDAFESLNHRRAKTFPAFLPILSLDRIYSRGFKPVRSEVLSQGVWSELSDHAALYAELEF